MSDPLSAIDHAFSLGKRLREISKNVSEAEFKNVLADLLGELADAKVEVATLKTQLAARSDELRVLRTAATVTKVKPTGVKWGCYQFEGEDGLFCTACYDARGVRSRTSRVNSRFRRCPVCKAELGSG